LGKYGTFKGNALLGQPHGHTYEIVNKELKIMPANLCKAHRGWSRYVVNDGQFVQPLTTLEIESLKRSGVCIEDIIRAQIKQHANYALQTEYSKDEYRKRKETKYSKSFTTLEPTLWHIAEYWFMKDPTRIRESYPPSCSSRTTTQMLTLANIHLGGHYLVVDNGGGILVAGVLERLGDEQRSL
ncbi:Gcd10p-domain-containing protein, partial [Ramaria rubella]